MMWKDSYLNEKIIFTRTKDLECPYQGKSGGNDWKICLGDFPDEPLYKIFLNGTCVKTFEDWPSPTWKHPDE